MVKYYFINKFHTNLINKLDKDTILIYRNYENFNLNEVIKLKKYLKRQNFKFLLSNQVKLALKLKLDGAYLPSFNFDTKHLSYSKPKIFITGSAYN